MIAHYCGPQESQMRVPCSVVHSIMDGNHQDQWDLMCPARVSVAPLCVVVLSLCCTLSLRGGGEAGGVRGMEGCREGGLIDIKRLVEIQWRSSLYILLSSSPTLTAWAIPHIPAFQRFSLTRERETEGERGGERGGRGGEGGRGVPAEAQSISAGELWKLKVHYTQKHLNFNCARQVRPGRKEDKAKDQNQNNPK